MNVKYVGKLKIFLSFLTDVLSKIIMITLTFTLELLLSYCTYYTMVGELPLELRYSPSAGREPKRP